ncbi:MAG: hypothetical protein AB7V04_06165 [Desulfomonilaceae bacterium]
MRLFTDYFQAMSVVVAFAEAGEFETAMSMEKAFRVEDVKSRQSRVKQSEKQVRKTAMRV